MDDTKAAMWLEKSGEKEGRGGELSVRPNTTIDANWRAKIVSGPFVCLQSHCTKVLGTGDRTHCDVHTSSNIDIMHLVRS